jgi:predicted phage-related endonuclease
LIIKEREFIEMIKNKIPPQIGGSSSETSYLSEQFPNALDEEMSIPQAVENLALEYNDLSTLAKETKERMDAIKNQIKLEGKEFKTLKGKDIKILMPTINKTLFDSKRFQADHPTLYTEYKTKTSSYRDFKVKVMEA